jgi:hypothetical protein
MSFPTVNKNQDHQGWRGADSEEDEHDGEMYLQEDVE